LKRRSSKAGPLDVKVKFDDGGLDQRITEVGQTVAYLMARLGKTIN